jgi:hypothetical protein
MEDVPSDIDLTDTQLRQVACHRTGRAHVDRTAIKQFLSRLEYPLHFLDFETVQSAVPLFDRSRPFMAVPFQFSLHVVRTKEGRFVDLLEVFRAMWYYHPSQNGSASLKAVLPALTASSYKGLEIDEGELASREFMRITFSRVSRRERRRVRRALEDYCAQDTSGLIDILTALEGLAVEATPTKTTAA